MEKIFAVIIAFLATFANQVHGAALGDIARNVQSQLVLFDAGLNPQPRRSRRTDLDVPTGKCFVEEYLPDIHAKFLLKWFIDL